MQSALDRRQAITEVLSDRRFETIENLMAEFGVSRSTIKRDLEILGCSVPIYTVQGNGGGVRVADGWYAGRRYLRGDQEECSADSWTDCSRMTRRSCRAFSLPLQNPR